MDPICRPPKEKTIRQIMKDIIENGNCKPDWWQEAISNLARQHYGWRKPLSDSFRLDEVKNQVVMYQFGDGAHIDRVTGLIDPKLHTLEEIQNMRIQYKERFRQFDLLCVLQCLYEDTKPEKEGAQPREYRPIPIDELLNPKKKDPLANSFDYENFQAFRLLCAECFDARRQYVVVLDKFANSARCARCGSQTSIFGFLGKMTPLWEERFGEKADGEREAIQEGAALWCLRKDGNMTTQDFINKEHDLWSCAGVKRFFFKDWIDFEGNWTEAAKKLISGED